SANSATPACGWTSKYILAVVSCKWYIGQKNLVHEEHWPRLLFSYRGGFSGGCRSPRGRDLAWGGFHQNRPCHAGRWPVQERPLSRVAEYSPSDPNRAAATDPLPLPQLGGSLGESAIQVDVMMADGAACAPSG